MDTKPEPKPMTESQRLAAEAHVAKLSRWDNLFMHGKPGMRQLRQHIRREQAHYRAMLLVDEKLKEATPAATESAP